MKVKLGPLKTMSRLSVHVNRDLHRYPILNILCNIDHKYVGRINIDGATWCQRQLIFKVNYPL